MGNIGLMFLVVILGLCIGSFSACMGYRIPNKISTYKERSFCPKCKKKLKWYMNIPLVSYIMLGGKCAYCKEKIEDIELSISVYDAEDWEQDYYVEDTFTVTIPQ